MHSIATATFHDDPAESNIFLSLGRLSDHEFAHTIGHLSPADFRRLCTALRIHPWAPNAQSLLRNTCLEMLQLFDRGFVSIAALPKTQLTEAA